MKKIKNLLFILLAVSMLIIGCNTGSGNSGESNGNNNEGGNNNTTPDITPGGSSTSDLGKDAKIIFLHHSTGLKVFNAGVKNHIDNYNSKNGKNYQIEAPYFPTQKYPNGWKNYPYDYWNIWVQKKTDQSKLEDLTKNYNLIIWKHCFPVSKINDSGAGEQDKTLANYKKYYNALKTKMKSFPNTRFIVWTGAVMLDGQIKKEQAENMKEFVTWVKKEWDTPNDNIYIWDFYSLETNGGLYLHPDNANGRDAHPNEKFCKKVAPLFVNRIVNVIEGRGDTTSISGK